MENDNVGARRASPLPIIIALLLLGLFIRAHNITALPIYTDESLHIRRAAALYDFHQHPAVESNGKLLFYFLIGIFDLKQMDTALWLARTMVALTSLITAALSFRIGQTLQDRRVGLIALAMYTLIPFAVFFERTALADPFAGLVGTALVWQSIRFARRPSDKQAIWVGVLIALTLAAKLTLAFLSFMPLVAVLLYGDYANLPDLLRRYFRYGVWAVLVVIALWSLVLVPAVIEYYTGGNDYTLYPQQLVEPTAGTLSLLDKIGDLWEKMTLLAWSPVTLLLLILTPFAALRQPKPVLLTLAWLVLVAIPAFFIVDAHSFQSRYLMSGVPALVVLFGLVSYLTPLPPRGGISPSPRAGQGFRVELKGEVKNVGTPYMASAGGKGLADRMYPVPTDENAPPLFRRGGWGVRSSNFILTFVFLIIWAGVFALPFARTAADDPVKLDMPHLDRQNYFEGYYNGYGIIEAMDYLRENGERRDGKVTVLLATRFCLLDYYRFSKDILYYCDKRFDPNTVDLSTLEPYRQYFKGTLPLYLVIDWTPQPQPSIIGLEHRMSFPKPYGDIQIEVWQFYLAE